MQGAELADFGIVMHVFGHYQFKPSAVEELIMIMCQLPSHGVSSRLLHAIIGSKANWL